MTLPTSDVLPLRAAYDIEDHQGGSPLRRAYVINLFEAKGLFEDFKLQAWTIGNSARGLSKYRWHMKLKERYETSLSTPGESQLEAAVEESAERRLEFALEAHLRDFLARNLEQVETGLCLHATDDIRGVEYAVDGGRIDLLAVDRKGKFVVVELKLSQGRTKALGQLLYYMG